MVSDEEDDAVSKPPLLSNEDDDWRSPLPNQEGASPTSLDNLPMSFDKLPLPADGSGAGPLGERNFGAKLEDSIEDDFDVKEQSPFCRFYLGTTFLWTSLAQDYRRLKSVWFHITALLHILLWLLLSIFLPQRLSLWSVGLWRFSWFLCLVLSVAYVGVLLQSFIVLCVLRFAGLPTRVEVYLVRTLSGLSFYITCIFLNVATPALLHLHETSAMKQVQQWLVVLLVYAAMTLLFEILKNYALHTINLRKFKTKRVDMKRARHILSSLLAGRPLCDSITDNPDSAWAQQLRTAVLKGTVLSPEQVQLLKWIMQTQNAGNNLKRPRSSGLSRSSSFERTRDSTVLSKSKSKSKGLLSSLGSSLKKGAAYKAPDTIIKLHSDPDLHARTLPKEKNHQTMTTRGRRKQEKRSARFPDGNRSDEDSDGNSGQATSNTKEHLSHLLREETKESNDKWAQRRTSLPRQGAAARLFRAGASQHLLPKKKRHLPDWMGAGHRNEPSCTSNHQQLFDFMLKRDAEHIFKTLRPEGGDQWLRLRDFEAYFKPATARRAWKIFLKVPEPHLGLPHINEGLRNFYSDTSTQSTQTLSSVGNTIHFLFSFVKFCILLVFGLYTFGFDVTTTLLSVMTLGGLLSVALSGLLSSLSASLIMLLWAQPYVVGDRIITPGTGPAGMKYWIDDVSLVSTTCRDIYDRVHVIPNTILSQQVIINLTRTPESVIEIKVDIGFRTEASRLKEFVRRVEAYVRSERLVWKPQLNTYIYSFDHTETTTLGFWLVHRAVASSGDVFNHKSLLQEFMRVNMNDLKIVWRPVPKPLDVSLNERAVGPGSRGEESRPDSRSRFLPPRGIEREWERGGEGGDDRDDPNRVLEGLMDRDKWRARYVDTYGVVPSPSPPLADTPADSRNHSPERDKDAVLRLRKTAIGGEEIGWGGGGTQTEALKVV